MAILKVKRGDPIKKAKRQAKKDATQGRKEIAKSEGTKKVVKAGKAKKRKVKAVRIVRGMR